MLLLLALAGVYALAAVLRQLELSSHPQLYAYLELTGSVLCLAFAANAVIRFRGTHDRASLILAFGFVVSALIAIQATFDLYGPLSARAVTSLRVPLAWMASRTLLAILLVAAVAIERRLPNAREPGREMAIAFCVVVAVLYLTSAVYLGAPAEPVMRPAAWLARPWDLLPAAIFLVAALGFERRLHADSGAFDYALYWAAWLNVACHVAASQSERLLDGPFTLADGLKVASYAVVLGGAFVENSRLFEQVRRLAISDPLTGLANYRRLLEALEAEIERSRRSGRPFAVLLLDLDGLKSVNDRYGHLTGSRALCRVANVLRSHSRVVDTPARYGGDEFALVLPEANADAVARAARRICDRVAGEMELPKITVSVGAAVFPHDGETVEKLLGAADRALYYMKGYRGGVREFSRIVACL